MPVCEGKWAQEEVWKWKKECCSGKSQTNRLIIEKQYHKECFVGNSLSLNLSRARKHLVLSEKVEQAELPILTTWWQQNTRQSGEKTLLEFKNRSATPKTDNYEFIVGTWIFSKRRKRRKRKARCSDARISSKEKMTEFDFLRRKCWLLNIQFKLNYEQDTLQENP